MPLHRTKISELLSKQNATHVIENDEQYYWKIKEKIKFKCECGTDAINEIRNIEKSGALCKECMAKQKSSRISGALKKEINHNVDHTIYKYCKGCSKYKLLKHFESDRDKDYNETCDSCIHRTSKSYKKIQADITTKNKSLDDTKICVECKTEKSLEEYIKANKTYSKKCKHCRDKIKTSAKERDSVLMKIEPSDDEKKCNQCHINKKHKEFSNDPDKCNGCVKMNNTANTKKKKKRRIEKIEKTLNVNVCIECINEYNDKIENCNYCDKCRKYCKLCDKYKSYSDFHLSKDKCKQCVYAKRDTKTIQSINKELKTIFTYNYLIDLMNESNAKLVRVIDVPLKRNSRIKFICSCEEIDEIQFKSIDRRDRVKCKKCINEEMLKIQNNTMIMKYGVRNSMHLPEYVSNAQKSGFSTKSYIFPSGKTVDIQGYENYALDDLLQVYTEDEIMVGIGNQVIPVIQYTFQDKNKMYYPDIYIPKNNRIVEVKSVFTFELQKDQNLAKRDACINQGYSFEFFIYDKKGMNIDYE